MSIWTNRWACPDWMFCPHKPHPYDNEYHSIRDGESGIMYTIEMVEGKDRPKEVEKKEFHNERGVSSLLLCMTKHIFGTGKLMVLPSSSTWQASQLDLKLVYLYFLAVFALAYLL
eukprot:1943599-Ditylum_brightwellii.AAC.1